LNPRPKDDPQEPLRAQCAIWFSAETDHTRPEAARFPWSPRQRRDGRYRDSPYWWPIADSMGEIRSGL